MFRKNLIKPKFWDKSEFSIYSLLLSPFSLVTFLINLFKTNFQYKRKIAFKTICVGNIYIGGTGKTQLVIKINDILKRKFKVSVIKKYYRNQIDEQDLLKNKTNLFIVKERSEVIKKFKNKKIVLIFDDGLQQKSINYDLSLVCFSSLNGLGNGKLLPAGPLRESLSELKNYDAVFINGRKNIKLIKKIKTVKQNIKIFNGKYILKNKKKLCLKSKYLAFCGVGTPENFFNLLKENNVKVVKKINFPDHFQYKLSDINELKNFALKNNLKMITTEKDFMKIKKFKKINVDFTDVDIKINDLKKFEKFLINNI